MGHPTVAEAQEADLRQPLPPRTDLTRGVGEVHAAQRRVTLSMQPGSRAIDIAALQRSIGNRQTALVVSRLREGAGGTATGAGQLSSIATPPSFPKLPTLPEPLLAIARNLFAALNAGEIEVTQAQASVLTRLLTSLVRMLAGTQAEAPVAASPGMIVDAGTVWLSAILSSVLGSDVRALLAGSDMLLPLTWLRQQGFGGMPLPIQAPVKEEPGPPPLALESSAIRTARLNEDFVHQSAARERAEATATRRTPTSSRQDARLERTIGQKGARGPDFAVDAHKDGQRAAARQKIQDAADRRRQREQVKAEHAPERALHKQAKDEQAAARAKRQSAAAAKELTREQDMRTNDYARLRSALAALRLPLSQEILPLHPDVVLSLNSTWSTVGKITKNLALAENDEKELQSGATQSSERFRAAESTLLRHMDTLRRHREDVKGAVRDTERRALEKGTAAISEANDRGLATMLTYQFLDLRGAHTNLAAAVSASEWTRVAGLTTTFKGVFEEHLPTYRLVLNLTQRALYLRQQMPVANADVVAVEAALLRLPGLPGPSVPAQVHRLNERLWPIQRPYAQGIFDAARVVSDDAANTALETLLDNAMIERGDFNRHYATSWDTQGGFSVEFNIKGVNNIVIHAHCSAGGVPKDGNGSHWKNKESKKFAGGTREISKKLRDALIDRSVTSKLKKPKA